MPSLVGRSLRPATLLSRDETAASRRNHRISLPGATEWNTDKPREKKGDHNRRRQHEESCAAGHNARIAAWVHSVANTPHHSF